jgi:hypothetical protein
MFFLIQWSMIKTSQFLIAQPPIRPLILWSLLPGFGPPILWFCFLAWLLEKSEIPVPVLYKKIIIPLFVGLWVAAESFGHFPFSMVALDSTALTQISLKAEAEDHYDRTVRGTIFFRLTDRLLVLSPKGNCKTLQRRTLTVIPLTEVRIIQATQ